MSKTPVELWLEALESGEYKQGKQVLHRIDGGQHQFCCLGVACEVYQQEVGDLQVNDGFSRPTGLSYVFYDDADKVLPNKVRAWLGLISNAGMFSDSNYEINGEGRLEIEGYVALTSLNDSGASFNRIAEVIRSTPTMFVEAQNV